MVYLLIQMSPFTSPEKKFENMKRSYTQATTQSVSSARSAKTRKYAEKRRTYRGNQLSLVPRNYSLSTPKWGFPNRLAIKHKYAESFTMTSTTSSLATHIWRANGMFDPNQSGTGHQPMYFDELGALYDHYTVVRAYAKFTFAVGVETQPVIVNVYLDDDTTVVPSINSAMEQGTATTKMLATGGNDPQVITKVFDATMFGPNPLDNDNLQGTPSTDPTEQQYFIVQAISTLAGTVTVACTAEIIYYAIWDELKTNNGS